MSFEPFLSSITIITNVAEENILYSLPRCLAIFGVIPHLHLQYSPLGDILDADIIKHNILYHVVVTTVDGQTPLIIQLRLILPHNVDVLITQSHDTISTFCISVNADKDRMRHVSPQR